jgi:hypothetical protein
MREFPAGEEEEGLAEEPGFLDQEGDGELTDWPHEGAEDEEEPCW